MPDSGVNRDDSSLKLGERLRSARKARAVSLERVAEALHLDEAIVIALEEERFEALGAPVFVRGHLRAYAKLVGLDADALLSAYEPAEPEEVGTPAADNRVINSVTINPMMLGVSVLAVCVVVALTTYVMQGDDSVAPDPIHSSSDVESLPNESLPVEADLPQVEISAANAVSESLPVADLPAAEPVPVASNVEESNVEESNMVEPANVAEIATEPRETVARPPADGIRLSLLFREESWVEISDVNRRLIFGLQREGRRHEVVGEPPISLLIGNANGVELSVNDEPYVVPSSRVNGKVARFEIGADALP